MTTLLMLAVLSAPADWWFDNHSEKSTRCREVARQGIADYVENLPSEGYRVFYRLCLSTEIDEPACDAYLDIVDHHFEMLFRECMNTEEV